MAEAVLSSIAVELIVKLSSPILKEIGLLWGVKDELENLKNTVSTIQAVLLDAEERQAKSNQVRDWLGKLKDAMYDADDLLDDFTARALQRAVTNGNKMTKVCTFFSSFNQLAFGAKMGYRVKAIRKKLEAITADKEFHLGELPVEMCPVTRGREQTHSFVQVEEVIGRDDDKVAILDCMLDSNVVENVSILSIVGIGGLGKTTLAQFVYNDDRVKNYFDLKMWVCVSRVFDVKTIVEKIIKSATKEKHKNLEMDQLQHLLRTEIDEKKYLLVLDDVWNEDREKWLSLKKLLMGGARGSKILVTTRAEKVAMVASETLPFLLKGLPENKAWSLFTQMAFRQGPESINPSLLAIGKEIVKKCAGVPLAVRTIGSLLYFRSTEPEWLSVKNNDLLRVAQSESDILPTLKLSYDHLPPHLKDCFAYCSLFPKGHEIDVQTLIKLWMAQGFIKSSYPSQCPEDVGHEYFMDLLLRSFFQEAEKEEWGNVKSCKMHDLMHDLAVLVSGAESIMPNSNADNITDKTRHVSFDTNLDFPWQISSISLYTRRIRTLLLPSQSWHTNKLGISTCDVILRRFKLLRVLDLHDSEIEAVPCSSSKLKHLRYLDLSQNNGIQMLPGSITKLQNLQVLKLDKCGGLRELPKDIGKLTSLRHIELSTCSKLTHMPCGLGKLTSLQTLTTFVVAKESFNSQNSGGLAELKWLNDLRGEIAITNLGYVKNAASEFKEANLKGKQYLRSLRLEWNRDDSAVHFDDEMSVQGLQPHPNLKQLYVDGWGGVRFQAWLSSLPNLVKLTLKNCKHCRHLPPLHHLPSLKTLWIQNLTALEYVDSGVNLHSRGASTFFPSLKELLFCRCYNLKGWWRDDDRRITKTAGLPSFPCLSKLAIKFCPSFTFLPPFPYLDEELKLDNSSVKPFQQTMMTKAIQPRSPAIPEPTSAATFSLPSLSSPLSSPLSQLKSLYMWGIEDLESLPEKGLQNLTSLKHLTIMNCPRLLSLPMGGFRGLTSLHSLCIFGCERLRSLSGVFQHLFMLEELEIGWCEELDILDGMQWQELRCLSSLKMNGLPQMVSLPEGLQHVTGLKHLKICHCERLKSLSGVFQHQSSPRLEQLEFRWCKELDLSDAGNRFQALTTLRVLHLELRQLVSLPECLQHATLLQVLKIINCEDLTDLPEWIGCLTSLQQLIIHQCPKLISLPEGMCCLTSLQQLRISKCPILSSRCRKGAGEEWPKIAHIPEFSEELSFLELF